MNTSIEEMVDLGREKLIQQAEALVKRDMPELEYEHDAYKQSVWTNNTNLIVKLEKIIRYYPLRLKQNKLTYEFTVDLGQGEILYIFTRDQIFISDTLDKQHIDFVKRHFQIPEGFFVEVYETGSSFKINIENEVAFGKYEIDKISGEPVMSPIEGSYAPMPEFPDSDQENRWFEIK